MLEGFVITLREGVEAALVVCLLLAYLQKTNRPALKTPVLWGFAAAVAASIGIAVVLSALGIDPENEALEGTLLLFSAVLVASLVVWMWIHGRKLKNLLESKVESIAAARGPGQSPALFVFTFFMVGREGVETVLFLAASTLSSEAVMTLVGGLAGIAVAIALGLSFLKGSLRIDLRKFFAVTTIMLLIFSVQLLVGAFHEFVEAQVIRPGNPEKYMAAVGPLVRHSALFVIAVIVLPFALVAWHALRAPAPAPPAANPAEERKQRAMTTSERFWRLGFSALAIVAVVAIGANHLYAQRELELSPTTMLEPRDGAARVPLSSVKEGELGRFGVGSGDRVVRFLVYRTRERPVTVFDACLLCGDKGYVRRDTGVMCLNCLAEINVGTIGFPGGCNPIPLPSTTQGGEIVVRIEDLEKQRDLFKPSETRIRCPYCGMELKVEDAVDVDGKKVCRMPECREKAGKK